MGVLAPEVPKYDFMYRISGRLGVKVIQIWVQNLVPALKLTQKARKTHPDMTWTLFCVPVKRTK